MAAARSITVLVHGLWTHGVLMELQRHYLVRMGFDTVCFSYPSVRHTLSENAARLAQFTRTLTAPAINWVGHSLGGVVILRMLEREAALPPGRVVLLGTPYGGSHSGRSLSGSALGSRMVGRSIREWLDMNSRPTEFSGREIGVLAGTLSVGLGRVFAPGLPAPNDGAVTVAETRLAAATDQIDLPVSHTGMVLSRRVARQVGAFLRDGSFDHSGADS